MHAVYMHVQYAGTRGLVHVNCIIEKFLLASIAHAS
jgi:hypothetical protein